MPLEKYSKQVISEDVSFELSRRAIPGFTPITVTGNNGALGTSLATIWDEGGLYVYPPAATKLIVASIDNRDAFGNTGATQTLLAGLDANGYWQYEVVKLNGQAGVETEKEYKRLNITYNAAAGSNGRNYGRMTIGVGAPVAGVVPTVYGVIDGTVNTQDNMMKQAIFSVPKGYCMNVRGYVVGVEATKEVTLGTYFQTPGGLMYGSGELILYQGLIEIPLDTGPHFSELTDWEIRGFAGSATFARVNAQLLLERKDKSVPFILENGMTTDAWPDC